VQGGLRRIWIGTLGGTEPFFVRVDRGPAADEAWLRGGWDVARVVRVWQGYGADGRRASPGSCRNCRRHVSRRWRFGYCAVAKALSTLPSGWSSHGWMLRVRSVFSTLVPGRSTRGWRHRLAVALALGRAFGADPCADLPVGSIAD